MKDIQTRCIRAPHNADNPYFMTSRASAQNTEVSSDARGILWYILSLPNDWVSHPMHLAKVNKMGKDKIYKIINILRKFGYCERRVEKDSRGRHVSTTYVFYEVSQKWVADLYEKEQKYPLPENPEAENPDPENKDITDYIDYKIDKQYIRDITPPIPPQKKAASPKAAKAAEERNSSSLDFSPEVEQVAAKMQETLKEEKPDYKPPKSQDQIKISIEQMIRLDKRTAEKIISVFRWAVADPFWADKMFKPNPAKYLREKFDQLEMKMNAKPEKKARKFLPSSDDATALAEWKAKEAIT